MAYPIHGKTCSVTVDGATANKVAELNEYSIEFTLDTDEITEFGDNWKDYVIGCAGWSGSMSGSFDPSDTYQKELLDLMVAATPAGTLADGRFQLDTGDYVSGTIIITGVSISAPISGKVPVEFSFLGSGQPSITV
jgi:hypothetical protein